MQDASKLIVGLDLSEEATQISIFNNKTFEVESIYEIKDEKATIPTALAVTANTKEWLFGREAVEYSRDHEGVLIHSFLTQIYPVEVYGMMFVRAVLIEKFLRKVLLLLKRDYPHGSIDKLVVTVKNLNPGLVSDIMQALANLGIKEDRSKVISYQLSYLYFALSQKKELWMNDVSMFDYDEEGLNYYQITVDRRHRPMVAKVITKEFANHVTYDMVKENLENLPYMFSNIVKNVTFKQIISTVYLTGVGFTHSWFEPCLQELCVGRRVFVGENLFCYGACYAAREMTEERKLVDMALLCDNTISFSVGIQAYWEANMREITLVEPGTPWYEVNHQFEVILDEESEVPFIIKDIMSREVRKHSITLEELPKRVNKMTKLQIRLVCTSPHQLIITVKDEGFGEICKASHRIWEKIVSV